MVLQRAHVGRRQPRPDEDGNGSGAITANCGSRDSKKERIFHRAGVARPSRRGNRVLGGVVTRPTWLGRASGTTSRQNARSKGEDWQRPCWRPGRRHAQPIACGTRSQQCRDHGPSHATRVPRDAGTDRRAQGEQPGGAQVPSNSREVSRENRRELSGMGIKIRLTQDQFPGRRHMQNVRQAFDLVARPAAVPLAKRALTPGGKKKKAQVTQAPTAPATDLAATDQTPTGEFLPRQWKAAAKGHSYQGLTKGRQHWREGYTHDIHPDHINPATQPGAGNSRPGGHGGKSGPSGRGS